MGSRLDDERPDDGTLTRRSLTGVPDGQTKVTEPFIAGDPLFAVVPIAAWAVVVYASRLVAPGAVWATRSRVTAPSTRFVDPVRSVATSQNRQRVEPGVSSAVPTAVAVRGLTS
jgi:hypothetical protein